MINFFSSIYYIILPICSEGVGKVRPAGQIRPAEAFYPAREVVFVYLASKFDERMQLSSIVFNKVWPKVPKKSLVRPTSQENCPSLM